MKESNEENLKEANIENDSKYILVLKEFEKYGYSKDDVLSQNDISLFLDRKSPENKFDRNLSIDLFKSLKLTEYSIMSINRFINGLFFFTEKIIEKKEELNKEYLKEKESYNNTINMCNKYTNEKVGEEGDTENEKLILEIIDINYNINLSGIKDIIIKIKSGEEEQEIIQEVNQNQINRYLEFKFTSCKDDKLSFILFTKTEEENITEIGSTIYSLEEMINQESITIQLEIPSNDNKENIAALINAKISKANLNYYELLKSNGESKLNKLMAEIEKEEKKIKKLEYIYLERKMPEDKKYKNKIKKDKKGLSKETFVFPKNKYIIQFNNERNDNLGNKDKKTIEKNEKKGNIK